MVVVSPPVSCHTIACSASEIMAAVKIGQEDNLNCVRNTQELNRKSVGASPCASSYVKPNKSTHFTRHSPNSNVVNSILDVAKLEGMESISSTDYTCATCYKSHVAIFKSHES